MSLGIHFSKLLYIAVEEIENKQNITYFNPFLLIMQVVYIYYTKFGKVEKYILLIILSLKIMASFQSSFVCVCVCKIQHWDESMCFFFFLTVKNIFIDAGGNIN